MALLLYGGLLLASLVLQSTVFSWFPLAGVRPDLILILVVIYSVYKGPVFGVKLGFAGGILLDLMVGKAVGLQTITKVLVGLGVGVTVKRLFRENPVVPGAAVMAATVFDQLLFFLGMALFGLPMARLSVVVQTIILAAVYNALLALVLYKGLHSIADAVAYWDELFRRSG